MTKYHISGYTPKVCKAQEGNCPLNSQHFESRAEAQAGAEKKIADFMERFPNHHERTLPTTMHGYQDFLSNYNASRRRWDAKARVSESACQFRITPEIQWCHENSEMLLTPVEDAPKKVSVYRAGSTEPGELLGESQFYGDTADYYRPEGHPPRHGSLFASATPKGFSRWFYARSVGITEEENYPVEMIVDPNTTYVYSISAWEDTSWRGAPPEHFWKTGMLLSRYNQLKEEKGFKDDYWEVIVPPFDVISAKEMSKQKVKKISQEVDKSAGDFMLYAYDEYSFYKKRHRVEPIETW